MACTASLRTITRDSPFFTTSDGNAKALRQPRAVSAGTTVATGAALQFEGGIAIGAETLILNGTGLADDGALRSSCGDNSLAGNVTACTGLRPTVAVPTFESPETSIRLLPPV